MIKKFLLLALICVGGGWLSGLLTQTSVKVWYPHLIKSPLTPPDFVFPVVWTLLYFSMAIASSLVWNSQRLNKQKALTFFFIQLVLNFAWSWLFFYLRRPDLALIELAVLWLILAYTIVLFWKNTPLAALLLLPYMAWVSFAMYLNAYIYVNN